MNVFFIHDINNDKCTLYEKESRHVIKVLRKTIGDKIQLTDGKGYFYEAEITDATKKKCELKILLKKEGKDKRPYKLHIAIAPTKSMDRLEWFIEKATEIGIDEISLFKSFHSERKTIKMERLEKIKISACKQSLKSHFPLINPLTKFEDFINQDFPGYSKYIAYISDDIDTNLKQSYSSEENAVIMIGPEGDFSHQEVTLAKKKGFIPISLGESRLRTETAGVVACHSLLLLNE